MKTKVNTFFACVDRSRQVGQGVVASIIVCMLLFAAVSCDNSDELFDDTGIFEEEFFSKETFTGTFLVHYGGQWVGFNCGWVLDANITQRFVANPKSLWIVPINLPEEFLRDKLFVNVTYRRHMMGGRKCDLPVVQIVAIEEAVSTSIFIVRKFEDCGWLLFEDLDDDDVQVVAPGYLPEEFQQDGLRVQATSHKCWRSPIVECEGIVATPIKILHITEASEREEDTETRITGGISVDIRTTPWQVLISTRRGMGQWTRSCGGAIIAPNFILTAAHCFYPNWPSRSVRLQPSEVQIHAGITCQREINNNNTFNVAEIITHPDVDVALLRLSRDILLNNITTLAINYLTSLNTALSNEGRRVRTSGWGMTRANDWSSFAECLQAVELNIISNQAASNSNLYRNLRAHEVAATGTGINRQGACHADSGGALTTLSATGEPVHIGIVAWGVGGCGGTNQNSPSVFERTSHVAPWILRYVAPSISGISICANATATFSIPPLPPSFSVRWIASAPLSIQGANNQTTVTVRHTGTSTANSRIRAEISMNGQVLHTVQRDVRIGAPPCPYTGTFNVRHFSRHIFEYQTASANHQWQSNLYLTPGYTRIYHYHFVDFAGRWWGWNHARIAHASLQMERCVGSVWYFRENAIGINLSTDMRCYEWGGDRGTLSIRLENECGTSPRYFRFPIRAHFFGYEFRGAELRLNSTSTILSVAIDTEGFSEMRTQNQAAATASNNLRAVYNIRLYDDRGNLLRQTRTGDDSIDIDVSDLPDGVYFVRICDGFIDEPITRSFVIRNNTEYAFLGYEERKQ